MFLIYLSRHSSDEYSPRTPSSASVSPRLQGFTREFLKGGAGTSEDLLQEIRDVVGELSSGKQVGVLCPHDIPLCQIGPKCYCSCLERCDAKWVQQQPQ